MGQEGSRGCLRGEERHLGTVQTITRPSINLNMTGSEDRETAKLLHGEGERGGGAAEAGEDG